MNAEGVIQQLKQRLADFQELGVSRLAIFGSIVTGNATGDSDIDVLVRFDPSRKSFDSFMEVRFLIQEIFPDVEIDLVLEDAIKPVIRDKILSEALDVA